MVMNSLNLCCLKSFWFVHQFWMRSLLDTVILTVDFFLFSTLNISCYSFLACRVSAERSAVNHMGFPLYVTCCFSLAAFNMLSLCLIFASLISNLSQHVSPWVLYGTVCTSSTWLTISFFVLGKLSTIISSKNFSYHFFLSSSLGPLFWTLVHLIFPRGLWDYTQFF